MKRVYPMFIKQDGDDFLVYVPDLQIYTEGSSFFDAINMARDAIGIKGIIIEDGGNDLPEASDEATALAMAKEDADEDFDFSTGTLTYVDVDFLEYRKKHDKRSVRKNVSIPYWMSVEAEKENINCSRVLQNALEKILSAGSQQA